MPDLTAKPVICAGQAAYVVLLHTAEVFEDLEIAT
jgi:hypothetical protein